MGSERSPMRLALAGLAGVLLAVAVVLGVTAFLSALDVASYPLGLLVLAAPLGAVLGALGWSRRSWRTLRIRLLASLASALAGFLLLALALDSWP